MRAITTDTEAKIGQRRCVHNCGAFLLPNQRQRRNLIPSDFASVAMAIVAQPLSKHIL